MDLIDAIAKMLNFKYEFQLAPDGRYGSFNKKTQQWDGLVRQILDGVRIMRIEIKAYFYLMGFYEFLLTSQQTECRFGYL